MHKGNNYLFIIHGMSQKLTKQIKYQGSREGVGAERLLSRDLSTSI